MNTLKLICKCVRKKRGRVFWIHNIKENQMELSALRVQLYFGKCLQACSLPRSHCDPLWRCSLAVICPDRTAGCHRAPSPLNPIQSPSTPSWSALHIWGSAQFQLDVGGGWISCKEDGYCETCVTLVSWSWCHFCCVKLCLPLSDDTVQDGAKITNQFNPWKRFRELLDILVRKWLFLFLPEMVSDQVCLHFIQKLLKVIPWRLVLMRGSIWTMCKPAYKANRKTNQNKEMGCLKNW